MKKEEAELRALVRKALEYHGLFHAHIAVQALSRDGDASILRAGICLSATLNKRGVLTLAVREYHTRGSTPLLEVPALLRAAPAVLHVVGNLDARRADQS